MTDDAVQDTPAPTESTPAPEVAAPTPAEPTPLVSESTRVVEQSKSPDPVSVIPEESQPAQNTQMGSRSVSQPVSTPQYSKQVGHKWNVDDRAKSAATQTRKIDARLAKILECAKAHGGTVTNDEIEKLLHVSDSTASRYTEELVKRGLLKIVGKGRGVAYSIVL